MTDTAETMTSSTFSTGTATNNSITTPPPAPSPSPSNNGPFLNTGTPAPVNTTPAFANTTMPFFEQQEFVFEQWREAQGRNVRRQTRLAELVRSSLEESLIENEVFLQEIHRLKQEANVMQYKYRQLETEVHMLREIIKQHDNMSGIVSAAQSSILSSPSLAGLGMNNPQDKVPQPFILKRAHTLPNPEVGGSCSASNNKDTNNDNNNAERDHQLSSATSSSSHKAGQSKWKKERRVLKKQIKKQKEQIKALKYQINNQSNGSTRNNQDQAKRPIGLSYTWPHSAMSSDKFLAGEKTREEEGEENKILCWPALETNNDGNYNNSGKASEDEYLEAVFCNHRRRYNRRRHSDVTPRSAMKDIEEWYQTQYQQEDEADDDEAVEDNPESNDMLEKEVLKKIMEFPKISRPSDLPSVPESSTSQSLKKNKKSSKNKQERRGWSMPHTCSIDGQKEFYDNNVEETKKEELKPVRESLFNDSSALESILNGLSSSSLSFIEENATIAGQKADEHSKNTEKKRLDGDRKDDSPNKTSKNKNDSKDTTSVQAARRSKKKRNSILKSFRNKTKSRDMISACSSSSSSSGKKKPSAADATATIAGVPLSKTWHGGQSSTNSAMMQNNMTDASYLQRSQHLYQTIGLQQRGAGGAPSSVASNLAEFHRMQMILGSRRSSQEFDMTKYEQEQNREPAAAVAANVKANNVARASSAQKPVAIAHQSKQQIGLKNDIDQRLDSLVQLAKMMNMSNGSLDLQEDVLGASSSSNHSTSTGGTCVEKYASTVVSSSPNSSMRTKRNTPPPSSGEPFSPVVAESLHHSLLSSTSFEVSGDEQDDEDSVALALREDSDLLFTESESTAHFNDSSLMGRRRSSSSSASLDEDDENDEGGAMRVEQGSCRRAIKNDKKGFDIKEIDKKYHISAASDRTHESEDTRSSSSRRRSTRRKASFIGGHKATRRNTSKEDDKHSDELRQSESVGHGVLERYGANASNTNNGLFSKHRLLSKLKRRKMTAELA